MSTVKFLNFEDTESDHRLSISYHPMLSQQLLLGCLWGAVWAQFPPEPKGITVLKSKFHENVTISYKEVYCTPKGFDFNPRESTLTASSPASARPHLE